jgi:hypothetical protein
MYKFNKLFNSEYINIEKMQVLDKGWLRKEDKMEKYQKWEESG